MINIIHAVTKLTQFSTDFEMKYPDISSDLVTLTKLISTYRSENDQQIRMVTLLEAEQLNQKIQKVLDTKWNSKLRELREIINQLTEYFAAKYQTHIKIKDIQSRISLKEILLVALRANKDYGPQTDLGLGREPYIPPNQGIPMIKLKKPKKLNIDEYGRANGSLDDRRVLDGRGLAVTLRHQIEKYDPKHRPWRNFLYKDYNDSFDFWKESIRNIEFHLIYPESQDGIAIIEKKWRKKDHTYKKDLLILYYPEERCWKCFIRDEKLEDGYFTIILENNSPLMDELKYITEKNCRNYDKKKLENLILQKQPFIKKTKHGLDGYLFSRDHSNFYHWAEKNSNLKNTNGVIYLNDLQSTHHLVRVNDKNELVYYLNDNQPITTKVDETQRRPDEYIYVMDLDGNLYISKEGDFDKGRPGLRIQHPSFKNGQRILAAGTIRVENGKVTYINNGSGHYIPGEFSLLKVVLELEKAGVLDKSCKVEFMTMDKKDTRYKGLSINTEAEKAEEAEELVSQIPAQDFIEKGKQAFLNVISLQTRSEFRNHTSNEGRTIDNNNLFDALWNSTEIAKIPFKTSGGFHAKVTHFLDEINNFIRSIGLNTKNKVNMANPQEFHTLRDLWKDFLYGLLTSAKDEHLTSDDLIENIGRFLAQKETSLAHRELNIQLKGMLQDITFFKQKSVECSIASKRVKDDYVGYHAQVQFAESKLVSKKEDPYQQIEASKLASYKLHMLTANFSSKSLATAEEMITIENQNLEGLAKK